MAAYPEVAPQPSPVVSGLGAPSASEPGVIQITFLRRLLGLADQHAAAEVPDAVTSPNPEPALDAAAVPTLAAGVACPNCGIALDPPPRSTRLCPSCRNRIVVRRSEGRVVYLTEAAVAIFEAERDRDAQAQTWARQRNDWLQHARLVGVPEERRRLNAAKPLSAAVVRAARNLYLVAVEREVSAARREKRWEDVARMRRRQAAALFDEAGGVVPPSDEVVALHRDGMAATLRELATVSREAELVGAGCCRACRTDDERVFRIVDELRVPRLPHADCPRGLCACDWWPAVRSPRQKRVRRRASATAPKPARTPSPDPDGEA